MTPKFFISAFFLAVLLNLATSSASSQPAENVFRTDASTIEEMAKMVLTQFSSFLAPKSIAATKLSSSNSMSMKIATTSAPVVTEKVRQCTCSESDDCIGEAYRSNSVCQSSCKSHLQYYSSNPEEFISCIPKTPTAHIMVNKCLKENIPQFCSADGSRFTFIPKPNYYSTQSSLTKLEFSFEAGIKVADMVILEHLKTFYGCVGKCLKEKIITCFDRKSCGVSLPVNNDLGNIAAFCPALKFSINSNLMKALPCFAMQQILPKFVQH